MPTCREADDADFRGIDAPLLCMDRTVPNGPLGIEQRHEGPPLRQPVFQHHAGDAVAVQPGAMPWPSAPVTRPP